MNRTHDIFYDIKYEQQEYTNLTNEDTDYIEIEYKIKSKYEKKYQTYQIKMFNKLKLLEELQKKGKNRHIEEQRLLKIKTEIEYDFIKLYKQKTHINELKQKLIMLIEIKTQELKKMKCPICFDRNSNIVLIPCGHIVCKICYDLLHSLLCPICRCNVEKYNKIYFN